MRGVCELPVGVTFVPNICCLLFPVWTVKAIFYIPLTSSHLAVKPSVQRQTKSRMGNRQRRMGGKTNFSFYLFLKMEDLSDPAAPSQIFTSLLEREGGQKGGVKTGRLG